MGRIKSLNPAASAGSSLFSMRYSKLLEDSSGVEELLRLRWSQDYVSYCCGHCGHREKLKYKAEELNNIVGSAFRMAYVAQLQQKPASNVMIASTDSSSIKSTKSSNSSSTASSSGHNSKLNSMSSSSTSWARQSHDKVLQQLQTRANCKNTNSSNSSEEDNVSTVSPTEMNQFRCWPSKPEPTKFLLTAGEDETSKQKTQCTKGQRSCSPCKVKVATTSPAASTADICCDLEDEEASLKNAPWFQAGIPREIALEILNKEPVGSFLVRQSTSKPGCYALSLRVPKDFSSSGISHYLILQTNRGYKIKGFMKEFPTISSLIIHHSVMPELLPCPLLLSRYCTNPGFQHSDINDFADIDSDPDYSTLSSFRRKMADLNV